MSATTRCPRCCGTGVERLVVDRADEPYDAFAARYDGLEVTCPGCDGECEVPKTECDGCGGGPVVALSDDGLFALCDSCLRVAPCAPGAPTGASAEGEAFARAS